MGIGVSLTVAAPVHASDEGALVVSNAAGNIIIAGQGLIFGYVGHGAIVVLRYRSDGTGTPTVSGAAPTAVGGTVYTGDDLRFYFPGGRYALQLTGSQIDISAVGNGVITTIGAGTPDDGSFAIDGGSPQPISQTSSGASFGDVAAAPPSARAGHVLDRSGNARHEPHTGWKADDGDGAGRQPAHDCCR
ncbi:MAG: hypothetical protein JOY72_04560 [Actinobacteria bacterium]|nr:hypothetical protein [Actinomycetota bacterium]